MRVRARVVVLATLTLPMLLRRESGKGGNGWYGWIKGWYWVQGMTGLEENGRTERMVDEERERERETVKEERK